MSGCFQKGEYSSEPPTFSVYLPMAMKVGRTGERIKLKNVTKVLKALHWRLRRLLLAEAQSSQRQVEMTEEAVFRAMCICTHMSVFKQSLTKFILPNESPHPHGK